MEQITAAPSPSAFTPLSDHQAQTPGTFFASKPVLHLHAIARITADNNTDLQRLTSPVDVYVTSHHLILFSSAASLGFQIPYPTITVTAQDGADVLLELNLSDEDTADEDIEFLQMRITPESIVKEYDEEEEEQASAGAGTATNGTTSGNDASTALFKAISDCQELNPDPRGDDDEGGEGAFDETAPGATGWITSENMADFMDEDGNFRMPAGMTVVGGEEEDGEGAVTLGAGAGTTRTAAEANDEGDEEEESKWQRTG
ncbi:hypothetical protein M409DRAFT_62456 [Zasmidium cellare ATCC 36951]|uniref:Regulator of volume decrease after cellular swelling-domain-containing protein n=1 Tax=Zasmidium cellare ATCC 36951 TaxID=1080233 RepID=A0A6A6D0N8_ZASCE|nr:uncharacterized protein M409DRAFT_62456 [Zasmidium cellare ATCC 36951]KAF2172745.1 hypothetical protein M409DRAFT_62456 [Zasmidium cellare ATCC 36951]